MTVALRPIESSSIAAHGYDLASRTLAVRFKSGARYDYADVPPEIAEMFAKHESAGRAFKTLIFGKYNHTQPHEGAAMSESEEETLIQGKNLNAPRVTPSAVDAQIVREQYYVFPDSTTTVCLLTLRNGFGVVGTSACAAGQNFDKEIGQVIARKSARELIWPLLGYALRSHLEDTKNQTSLL